MVQHKRRNEMLTMFREASGKESYATVSHCNDTGMEASRKFLCCLPLGAISGSEPDCQMINLKWCQGGRKRGLRDLHSERPEHGIYTW